MGVVLYEGLLIRSCHRRERVHKFSSNLKTANLNHFLQLLRRTNMKEKPILEVNSY